MLFRFNNLTYQVGNENRHISVTASVDNGSVLVVRGPSGAGKTTLLRTLARLSSPAKGECFLKEKSWSEIPPSVWRANIHYLSQRPVLFDGTVKDNLAKPFETKLLSTKLLDWDKVYDALTQLLLPRNILEQDARTLSGGEAARIVFIRALLIEPTVLLLDEPTAALDKKSQAAFYNLLHIWLKIPGHAVALVSHNQDYSSLTDLSFLDIINE